jgi:hypothetical protein
MINIYLSEKRLEKVVRSMEDTMLFMEGLPPYFQEKGSDVSKRLRASYILLDDMLDDNTITNIKVGGTD